ncbi:ABC transporter permease [Cerasicoccus arenae]|uniref:Permease n=1 Tax=Cerasicoccus arenae TaxID=424488 RepID=A0A8J3DAF1_9BACT|nr:FtsX-like permease family protein [Cerasicoccus arenae]MBK1858168.1 FtsX-like permease family protein [Cerasicoccus arenae]GHB96912.1 permease [Cerasicoccus arenae]
MSFTLLTAWRDARSQHQRLLLCAISIVFGVAALVAINSFGDNLRATMDKKALTLLGSDLRFASRTPFSTRAEVFFEQLGGEQSRETRFNSMALFPTTNDTRLVQIRSVDGGFPFYGEFETDPAGIDVAGASEPIAIVDPVLLALFELKPGDPMTIGQQTFTIAGAIVEVPGESAFAGLFAPRVYIPSEYLEATGLVGYGTIAFHRVDFKLPPGADADIIAANAKLLLDEERIQYNTVATKKKDLGQSLENLYRFFNLIGMIALLLGGVGVAGAVQAYLRGKLEAVAVLRCLGCSVGAACRVFLWQVLAVTFVGALIGALLGVIAQVWLPAVIGPLLPFEIESFVSWPRVFEGLGFGWLIAALFSLLPLLPLRRISPLRALRASYQPQRKFDPLVAMVWAVIGVLLVGYCAAQTQTPWHGGAFAVGLGVALIIFTAAATLLRKVLSLAVGRGGSYVVRQGLANLHRPNNRTLFLVVTLGMGAFLIQTLFLIQGVLLSDTELVDSDTEPNVLFFDIQSDQLNDFTAIVESEGLTVADSAPIVTMRLAAVNGRSVTEIKSDRGQKIDEWILNREWRSTWRTEPSVTEEVIAGEFVGQWDGLREPVPISLELDMSKDLGVGVGDTLTFDIQGLPLQCKVSSIRKVDWKRMRPNFFAVFPEGVLEGAPTWHITFVRAPTPKALATLQRKVVEAHPNISAVDLSVVLDGLRDILGRVSFALRFMASFTLLTGIVVLASAVITSRYQRYRESVLLRTIGASAAQIRAIMAVEYLAVGLLAGVVGALLAWAAAAGLAIWVFETNAPVPIWGTIATIIVTTALTLATGLANSRGISNSPPLAVLRAEAAN